MTPFQLGLLCGLFIGAALLAIVATLGVDLVRAWRQGLEERRRLAWLTREYRQEQDRRWRNAMRGAVH